MVSEAFQRTYAPKFYLDLAGLWEDGFLVYDTPSGLLGFILAFAVAGAAGAALGHVAEWATGVLVFGSVGALLVLKMIQRWRALQIWEQYLRPEFDRVKDDLLASAHEMLRP